MLRVYSTRLDCRYIWLRVFFKMKDGFILLSRSLLDSDVFASQKLLKIWVWCLLKANFKDKAVPLKTGKGETIIKLKRGSFLFGRFKAEEELCIDGSTVYKSIHKLKDMEMIEIESNNQYSVVTICNYDKYQQVDEYKVTSNDQPSNKEVTRKEQVSNTTKNSNKEKKDNKEKKEKKEKFTPPPLETFLNYFKENGFCEKVGERAWRGYHSAEWIKSNGKPVLNWKQTCHNVWFKEENRPADQIKKTTYTPRDNRAIKL